MAAPLQDLLTDDDAIRKVREYLILKGKGVPVPKAVVNGKVLKILSSKLAKNNDVSTRTYALKYISYFVLVFISVHYSECHCS